MKPDGSINFLYSAKNFDDVSRFLARIRFICGSGNVIQISATSPGAKKDTMCSICVRRKAAFFISF